MMKQIQKRNHAHTAQAARNLRYANVPKITYPAALPINSKKDEIIEAIKRHRVVVITGETGSGKTTQIPKMCLEAGRGIDGIIGCTQPRRVAAITVAHRIADELGEQIGRSVGYQIRFDDKTSRDNYIKIMTDGILLNEAQNDPYLRRYDTIIVDEAHERSLNIDFILGILRSLLAKRKDLKVIITSATIDTEKFARAFHAPIIEVSGRMFPVELRYSPIDPGLEEASGITYMDAAISEAQRLMKNIHDGDMLIFMPTEQDIRETCDLLEAKLKDSVKILPLFARLSWTDQRRVFAASSVRKIIVATNIAETSITIPGVRYVIDTGLARMSQYNPRSRTTSLPVRAISKSSADQRKGRCGRVQNGICIRLYDAADLESRPLFTEPEILRSNLAEVILRMLYLKLGNITSFPFIDPPNPKNIRDGIEILKELGAIEALQKDSETDDVAQYAMTDRGRMMARLPLDPRISRMIIEAKKEGCVEEITIIAAALSIQDPRERPAEFADEADKIHAVFADPASDFVTLLHIWNAYHRLARTVNSKSKVKKFCREHYLSYRRMREWIDVYDQIKTILDEHQWHFTKKTIADEKTLYDVIHKSILSGYLSHIATKKEKSIYTAAKGKEVMIFPGSGLFKKAGNWIVAAEMVETSRLFARTVANIHSEWLEELGGNLCRSTYSEPHWSRNRGEVSAYEQVTLFGLVIISKRPVSYGRIYPDEASEIFIRTALVEGDVKTPIPFLMHNHAVIEKIVTMEDKIRRRNLLAGEDELARFYQERIPGIYDIRTLLKTIKERGGDDFLRMKEDDILKHFPPSEEIALYPDEVNIADRLVSCEYRFDPGKPHDGVTMKLPVHMISAISEKSADWMIPGLLKDKIMELLKGLPKEFRKNIQPLSRACELLMPEMNAAGEDFFISTLAKAVHKNFGVDIPISAWNPHTLSDHLKIRYAVVDERGRELQAGRDLTTLQNQIASDISTGAFITAQRRWEKTGLTEWNFGDLPETISLGIGHDYEGFAYPALDADDGSVHIRLHKNASDAESSHRKGVIQLYSIIFRNDLKYLKKGIVFTGDIKILINDIGMTKILEKAVYEKTLQMLFDRPIRTQEAFESYAKEVSSKILLTGQDILIRIEPLLKAYHHVVMKLRSLKRLSQFNQPAIQYLAEIEDELNRLLPPNFLMLYEADKIPDIIRYLRAMAIRTERDLTHLEKAFRKTDCVKAFVVRFADIVKGLPQNPSDAKKAAIEDLRWMIEEFKISIFAQEIKTAFPVSEKRLEKKFHEIERMM